VTLDGAGRPGHGRRMTHRFTCRVYYEDTDLAGIVYYANYLKFIERARAELLRDLGIDQVGIKAETGVVFAVRRVSAEYLSPARHDEVLTVETRVLDVRGARAVLGQDVLRAGEKLFASEVTIIALKADGSPAQLPDGMRQKLAETGA